MKTYSISDSTEFNAAMAEYQQAAADRSRSVHDGPIPAQLSAAVLADARERFKAAICAHFDLPAAALDSSHSFRVACVQLESASALESVWDGITVHRQAAGLAEHVIRIGESVMVKTLDTLYA